MASGSKEGVGGSGEKHVTISEKLPLFGKFFYSKLIFIATQDIKSV